MKTTSASRTTSENRRGKQRVVAVLGIFFVSGFSADGDEFAVLIRATCDLHDRCIGIDTPRSGQFAGPLPTEAGRLMRNDKKGATYMLGEETGQGQVFRGRQVEERGCYFSGLAMLVVSGVVVVTVAAQDRGLLSLGACFKLVRWRGKASSIYHADLTRLSAVQTGQPPRRRVKRNEQGEWERMALLRVLASPVLNPDMWRLSGCLGSSHVIVHASPHLDMFHTGTGHLSPTPAWARPTLPPSRTITLRKRYPMAYRSQDWTQAAAHPEGGGG